jgi:superfamily II DNA or RNA helicase
LQYQDQAMIVLHGSWLPQSGGVATGFVVWGEVAETGLQPRPRGRPKKSGPPIAPRAHPFGASASTLRQALPAPDLVAAAAEAAVVARLPSLAGAPLPTRPFLRETSATGQPELADWAVTGLVFEPAAALGLLAALPAPDDDTPGVDLGADLMFWRMAARFVFDILAGQRSVPALVEEGGRLLARWIPLLDAPEDRACFDQLVQAMPPACRALARDSQDPVPGPRVLLADFLNVTLDAFARRAADFGARPRGRPSPARAWLLALASDDPQVDLPATFVEQYRTWAQTAREAAAGGLRICFRLDPPDTPSDGAVVLPAPDERTWTLRYFLQASDDPSLLVPAAAVWRERGSTLRFLNRVFDQPQERLLAGLGHAARVFAPIERSLSSARPEACPLTAAEAYTFIREAALLLQSSGFGVLLPGLGAGLGVRVRLAPKSTVKPPAGGVARLSFESVIQFDWELALGDQPLSRAEFEQLAALKVPLVQIRGQWVELRPEQLERALEFFRRRAGDGALTLAEALRLALAPAELAGMPVTGVETRGWFGDMLRDLSESARLAPLPTPPGFVGTLRRYQQIGFSWLAFLRRYGLGACLADDMGLGKTLQAIALILHQREQFGHKPSIVICPTSVVSNWRHEVARFAPSLKVLVHHGAERRRDAFAAQAVQHDLVISSYPLLHRDEERLTEVEWGAVILDEAQNIKNPDTRQARAARKLRAEHHIALTGTPVENRLAELWSIFQFLNPGYLGSQADFQAHFARPIERAQDEAAARRLKALVGPFILRRVKTDPAVISDLPAKNEIKVFCTLTKEQATLYAAVVRDSLRRIEESEGIARRGVVLATLLKLKQVCNHPAQFLRDGSALADRSGKLARLVEMLEEVRAVRERALVFTQFAEMGQLLEAYLQATFGDDVLFLHGGTPAQARELMIRRFQEDPHGPFVFVLSIKAGGTGLNLTRANNVFHFDRWWNPAVENQATDRAFRIGQVRNVQVYKYICAGTVEERIDELIERKQALAERIVGTSEAWLTELSTEQLRELLVLREEAVT